MKIHMTALALGAALLALAACEKSSPPLPAPIVETPVPAGSGATATAGPNASVPAAATVFPPGSAPPLPVLRETDGTRKPAQEADTNPKPMPGQNNDHSAPLSTDK